jgi:hypothetical protein
MKARSLHLLCRSGDARGNFLSRPSILDEVRRSLGGVKEELLGQTVNAYGRRKGQVPFHDLLAAIDEVPGIRRIRFTSSHPIYVTPGLVEAYRRLKHLCPHLHLPVQSGSDRVLDLMRRRYTRAEYLDIVGRLREARPDLAITTDIITGFPGETSEDFEETLSLLAEVRFSDQRPPPSAPDTKARISRPGSEARERLARLAFSAEIGLAATPHAACGGRWWKGGRPILAVTGRDWPPQGRNFTADGRLAVRRGSRRSCGPIPGPHRVRLVPNSLREHWPRLKVAQEADAIEEGRRDHPRSLEQRAGPHPEGPRRTLHGPHLDRHRGGQRHRHRVGEDRDAPSHDARSAQERDPRAGRHGGAEIEVTELRDNTFFAAIHLRTAAGPRVLDSRPSDAVALALRVSAPIFVEERVIAQLGTREEDEEAPKQGKQPRSGPVLISNINPADKFDKAKWAEFLESLDPEDFGKYKM